MGVSVRVTDLLLAPLYAAVQPHRRPRTITALPQNPLRVRVPLVSVSTNTRLRSVCRQQIRHCLASRKKVTP